MWLRYTVYVDNWPGPAWPTRDIFLGLNLQFHSSFVSPAATRYSTLKVWSVSVGCLLICLLLAQAAVAQNSDPEAGVGQPDLQRLAAEAAANRDLAAAEPVALSSSNLNVLELLRQGGGIMALIGIISLLVVAVAFERLFALRRAKLFPSGLRRELRRVLNDEKFYPQVLFDSSKKYNCAASRIMQDMLQKVGRPIPEVEATLVEGTQREADYLFGNVRWLTLAAAVTPLIGLLGTVWGMIIAFHDTTQLGTGSNKAEFLAEGIYVALVTTLGGLAVAIPAAVFAHFFEGRITQVLALIDSELRRLIPRFEPHEGVARYDLKADGLVRRSAATAARKPEAPRMLQNVADPSDLSQPPVRPSSRQ